MAQTQSSRRARWRKAKRTTGLAAIGEAGKPDSYEYWRGNEHFFTVAPSWRRYQGTLNGWYWYGLGANSLSITGAVPTVEQAKTEALNYLKAFEATKEAVSNARDTTHDAD